MDNDGYFEASISNDNSEYTRKCSEFFWENYMAVEKQTKRFSSRIYFMITINYNHKIMIIMDTLNSPSSSQVYMLLER